jgi:hypothetical protein
MDSETISKATIDAQIDENQKEIDELKSSVDKYYRLIEANKTLYQLKRT